MALVGRIGHERRQRTADTGVPCLFRRASLHAANLDSGDDYGIDVCADELTVESEGISADDLRAVASGLNHFNTDAGIRRAITSVALVQPIGDYVSSCEEDLTSFDAG